MNFEELVLQPQTVIWWEDSDDENVVYDNGFHLEIADGCIVIHSSEK